ncbi:hypothetical protein SDC9_181674 [bioreactor metagenome]|uniref:Uncharacterized protein n=1 Tax=bioreactor metagenome TaxID=1076179 RepID=A0A645H564_9ZZZZ
MMPSRPSEPRIISRTLGPDEVDGSARRDSTSPWRTARRPLTMSAMSPYLSDCMPVDRVAIQPPSVEWVNESGKCPIVQPRRPSCSSICGPSAPAWIRASPDSSSISSTLVIRPRSTETTVRRSAGIGSRAPTMFEPPPNGISTASASTQVSTICCTWASSAG